MFADLPSPDPSLGFSWGHCCQKWLPGLAKAVKARLALLASRHREWDCTQGKETKGQSELLHPSPSLGRHEIWVAGKGCSLLLRHCRAVLRPGPCLMFGYICCVGARNSLSQILQMQTFRWWTTSHITWKHFFLDSCYCCWSKCKDWDGLHGGWDYPALWYTSLFFSNSLFDLQIIDCM